MNDQTIPIVSVTGTKGKTTTVNLVASILRRLEYNTLHVDTTGHFVNGTKRSDGNDSKAIWGLKTPSLSPGRYLGEFLYRPELKERPAAVLECAFSCARRGLGYRYHKVGVFLNVFEDHIDPNGWIKSKQDLAEAKSFVFSSLGNEGWAVFNADDELVCDTLKKIPPRNIQLIPCGFQHRYFDTASHLAGGGTAIMAEEGEVILRKGKEKTVLADLNNIPWTHGGAFEPSVWNLMHACGAIYGFLDGILPDNFRAIVENTHLDTDSGRLVTIRTEGKPTIIADYAHEKVSLRAVAALAKNYAASGGKVIGVVRLNHERPDDVIAETGKVVAESYDTIVVYDKIDGHWRQPVQTAIKRYPQVIGRTSQILTDAIAEVNPNVRRILREDQAIEYAASLATPADVVVIIVNDNVTRSLEFIQKAFSVELP